LNSSHLTKPCLPGFKCGAQAAQAGGGVLLRSIGNSSLSDVVLADNSAAGAGGGLAALACGGLNLRATTLTRNRASLGGGIAADAAAITLLNVSLLHNDARASDGGGSTNDDALEEDADAATRAAVEFAEFGGGVYGPGVGGGALLQRASLHLSGCQLVNNTAATDGGGLYLDDLRALDASDCVLERNTATAGRGGGAVISGGGNSNALMSRIRFASNAAPAGSGGGLHVDASLGAADVKCGQCSFQGNMAGQDGGGFAALGLASLDCSACSAAANTAGQRGGWIHCSGCTALRLSQSNASENSAGGAGGAVSCEGCGQVDAQAGAFTGNAGASGGGLAVRGAVSINIAGLDVQNNTAAALTSAPVPASGQVARASSFPPAWQGLYGVGTAAATGAGAAAGAAAASLGCSYPGVGGGLCLSGARTMVLTGSQLLNNSAAAGGAVYASASCSAAAGAADAADADDNHPCQVDITAVSADGNGAADAGGVLYTSTPRILRLAKSEQQMQQMQQQQLPQSASSNGVGLLDSQLLEQLAQDNSVQSGGYGPAVASFPARMSLLVPTVSPNHSSSSSSSTSSSQGSVSSNIDVNASVPQQQTRAGRRLQQQASAIADATSGGSGDIGAELEAVLQSVRGDVVSAQTGSRLQGALSNANFKCTPLLQIGMLSALAQHH
jgi:hypothetical protein